MRRLLLLLALVPAACASPDPRYFALVPAPGTPAPGGPATIEIRRAGLAGYLDRADIVRQQRGTEVRISNRDRWVEPLGDMTTRILAEDLTQRLPGSTVFAEAGSIAADTDATVETDIQRLDAREDGTTVLYAQVAVSRGRSNGDRLPVLTRSVRLTMPARIGTAPMVNAMSVLLGQLADVVASMLRGV